MAETLTEEQSFSVIAVQQSSCMTRTQFFERYTPARVIQRLAEQSFENFGGTMSKGSLHGGFNG